MLGATIQFKKISKQHFIQLFKNKRKWYKNIVHAKYNEFLNTECKFRNIVAILSHVWKTTKNC